MVSGKLNLVRCENLQDYQRLYVDNTGRSVETFFLDVRQGSKNLRVLYGESEKQLEEFALIPDELEEEDQYEVAHIKYDQGGTQREGESTVIINPGGMFELINFEGRIQVVRKSQSGIVGDVFILPLNQTDELFRMLQLEELVTREQLYDLPCSFDQWRRVPLQSALGVRWRDLH